MENLKIENSAEAQRLLFKLGYQWACGENIVKHTFIPFLFVTSGLITHGSNAYYFNSKNARHITLDELRTYKPMLTHTEVIERLKNGLGVEIERKPSEWVKLTKFDSLKVFCSDYKFRGCE